MDQEFIASLDEDFYVALEQVCEHLHEFHRINSGMSVIDKHEKFLGYLGAVEALVENHNERLSTPNLTGNKEDNIRLIFEFFTEIYEFAAHEGAKKKISRAKAVVGDVIQKVVIYEFEDDDYQRVQVLISEIRSILSDSDQMDEEFKSRILKRLEKLQSEMHKKVSDLDKFWGIIVDAGVALGKFGKNAEPLVKRFREIADIVWRTQTKAENLPPSASPLMLSDPEDVD